MRDLIVSAVAVLLLIGAWFLFYGYSENRIGHFTQEIDQVIIPLAQDEVWDESSQHMDTLSQSWDRYRRIALLFLDNDTINEIDYSMVRSARYIEAQDVSNSTGELLAMSRRLDLLVSNEKISLANIM